MFNVVGGPDLSIGDVNAAAQVIGGVVLEDLIDVARMCLDRPTFIVQMGMAAVADCCDWVSLCV